MTQLAWSGIVGIIRVTPPYGEIQETPRKKAMFML